MSSRPQLPTTEAVHPATAALGQAAPLDGVDLMLAADRGMLDAIARVRVEIAAAVTLIAERLRRGGRLFYVGAGTSGRLGVLDAVECPPTFCTPPEWVQGVLAGGDAAMWRAVEGAEDDRDAGGRDLVARGAKASDVVVGITASGRTPYVHGALAWAREQGSASVLLACVAREELIESHADVVIGVATGAESLAGSTRLRAGTATKLVLNMLSTLTMAQLGRVYGNLMVDVNTAGNAKLQRRGIALIERLVPCAETRASELFAASAGQVKLAVVMGRLGLSREHAAARLQAAAGFLDRALAD